MGCLHFVIRVIARLHCCICSYLVECVCQYAIVCIVRLVEFVFILVLSILLVGVCGGRFACVSWL